MSSIEEVNPLFVKSYELFVAQNSLSTLLSMDTNKINFILFITNMAYKTYTRPDNRMVPDPKVYFPLIYGEELSDSILTQYFAGMENTLAFFEWIRLFFIPGRTNDIELVARMSTLTPIGINFVRLLYFFIFTNNIAFETINVPDISDKGILFKTSHSYDKEKEFYDIPGEQKTLFHGTSIYNMYSMMRNGVKSMSKSKYQTNGNVYGDGIYLADNFSTAHSYGKTDKKDDTVDNTSRCVLVFEAKNLNPQNGGWCFVQQDNEIILRCIFWISNSLSYMSYPRLESDLSRFSKSYKFTPVVEYVFKPASPKTASITAAATESSIVSIPPGELLTIKDPVGEPKMPESVLTATASKKRFEKEIMKAIEPESWTDGILRANFLNPTDPTSPLLVLVNPIEGSPLSKDCEELGYPGILFAIYICAKYPFEAPGIRVVEPVFKEGTGRVGFGGSLCADILFNGNGQWSPACFILSTLRSIMIEICSGGRIGEGRIERLDKTKKYTYATYLASRSNQANLHGWNA